MSISSIATTGAASITQQLQAQAQAQAQAQTQASPTQQAGKPHHHHGGGAAPAQSSSTAQPSVFTASSILDTLA